MDQTQSVPQADKYPELDDLSNGSFMHLTSRQPRKKLLVVLNGVFGINDPVAARPRFPRRSGGNARQDLCPRAIFMNRGGDCCRFS